MSQLAFEGMPRRLYAAAPARLATYLDCPRRYRFGYLHRPTPSRGTPWGRTSVGASAHTALARWWGLPRARRTPQAGGQLLEEAWIREGFRDAAQSAAVLARTRGHVERYLAALDPQLEPLGVEMTVAVRTARASLWGRVDRVDARGERAVVVDYKTGRSVPGEQSARTSLALAVYAAAVAETLRVPCTRVELHHLPSGTVAAWEHSVESLAAALASADEVAAELDRLDEAFNAGMPRSEADRVFPANVAERCGSCDFRALCRPGQAVPKQPPWTGLGAG